MKIFTAVNDLKKGDTVLVTVSHVDPNDQTTTEIVHVQGEVADVEICTDEPTIQEVTIHLER